ncbi:MAG: helix-turn-helix domain-containing protein [Pseudomonadota bacterium]
MRPLRHPDTDAITLQGVLYALADPVRMGIVRRLYEQGTLNCAQSCGDEALPRATLSRHFDLLRDAGLVRTERDGVQYLNVLRLDDVETRFPGLLANLLQAAEREAAPSAPSRKRARRTAAAD